MPRAGTAKRIVRRAKIFALAKGFRGRAKNCYSIAVRRVHKALQYAYRERKLKKRNMRTLWIQRINFGAMEHGINYSRFVCNMAKCNIALNRKVLSELAIHEPKTFKALTDIAKRRQGSQIWETLEVDRIKDGEDELYQPRLVNAAEGRIVMETDV